MERARFSKIACPGKTPRFGVTAFNPFDWIAGGTEHHDVCALDGYVVRVRDQTVTAILSKQAVGLQGKPVHADDFPVDRVAAERRIIMAQSMARRLSVPHFLFAWEPQFLPSYSADDDRSQSIFGASVTTTADSIAFERQRAINIRQLRAVLRKYRGGYGFSNPKKYTILESRLECYLASHPANDGKYDPWPGDCDAIIEDKRSGAVVAIVEFKTVQDPNVDVTGESLEKYLHAGSGNSDDYRISTLFALYDAVSRVQQVKPKFYYVAWGTENLGNHAKVLVTTLTDRAALKGDVRAMIDRPAFGAFSRDLFDILTV